MKTVQAIRIVLSVKKYSIGFVVLGILIFIILFQIQVSLTPGNSIGFQAKLYGSKDWLLLGFISSVNSLFIMMQIYLYGIKREARAKLESLGGVGVSGFGTASGFLASIFGTATCSLCVGALFGFLGSNTVLLFVNNKDFITSVMVVLLILSLVISSKRFHQTCESCGIVNVNKKRE